jgi:GT2 family glycosyltransferase
VPAPAIEASDRDFRPPEWPVRAPISNHQEPVDIVLCVHDALAEVQACLASIRQHTTAPYRVIVVDDGSGDATRDFLSAEVSADRVTLIRNPTARGYTLAANQGLRATTAPFVILLNSDTVVSRGWVDRLVACALATDRAGLVGPLSNAASWQSIPEIEAASKGDWAENPLPMPVDRYAELIAATSARLYPQVDLLNGFCLLLTREAIQAIGLFDEETFGAGYCEENDYSVRARAAGFRLAVADDVWIYHAQSRSYSHERRRALDAEAQKRLRAKHGAEAIDASVELIRHDRILAGIRAHSRVLPERIALIAGGKSRWDGRRVMFLLPIGDLSGGAKVVLQEAEAMRRMGVDASVVNLEAYRPWFEQFCAEYGVPVCYVANPAEVARAVMNADAVIATAHATVEWMADLPRGAAGPIRAYYVQDYEPLFYPAGSAESLAARDSYGRYPDLIRLTKTEWNRAIVQEQTGNASTVIGPSVDLDVCRPRPRRDGNWPARPLRIAAMIRPSSERRRARETLAILRRFEHESAVAAEFILFGSDRVTFEDPAMRLPAAARTAGVLNHREAVASLLNEVDVFVDFSSHQAMGLTALEAMASGAAAIVPQSGGASSFAVTEVNALVVDTTSSDACLAALMRVAFDHELRRRLQTRAIEDVVQHFPERAAWRVLERMFA